MKKILRDVLVVMLALAGLVLSGGTVLADDTTEEPLGDALRVTPTGTSLMLEAGEVLEGQDWGCTQRFESGCQVEVTNTGTNPYSYKVYVTPYIVSGSENNLSFSTENGGTAYTQIARWIKVQNTDGEWVDEAIFTITPGETQIIKYQVTVPENAPGGSQYAVLWAQILNEGEVSGIQTVGQVGSVISGRAHGNSTTTADIYDIQINRFSFNGKGLVASAKVANTGNTDFLITYGYVARTLFGREVYNSNEGGAAQQMAAYPEITYDVEWEWQDAPMLGIFQVEFWVRGADQETSKKAVVIIMPLVALILFILLLTIIIVWIIIIIRKRKERKARKLV